ncbi:MAG: FAD-binding oxidoreductase [Candidatus Rokubacteria bacterium]|nr:FAD-binding oxidoreductase [Candidatus Rokubacteria bacterium]
MRLSRRRFLIGTTALAWSPAGCAGRAPSSAPTVVDDIHSRLNATRVDRVVLADSRAALEAVVRGARAEGKAISIAGGRHAMGGQQFGAGTILLDTTRMNRVLRLDPEGLVEVEAGIQWPELIGHLLRAQEGRREQWGIIQKQTGADRLSLGGALAANVHGRGLRLAPIVGDVESFTLVDAGGNLRRCSRRENPELFRLAIGGYGLFGPIASVTLRLGRRLKLERVVEVIDVDDLLPAVERRIADGFLYGDCQYATDPASDDFLRRGVFSCYRPVDDRTPMPEGQKELSREDWDRLLYLSHVDKRRAFELYAAYYRSTSGQVYWSDTHQLSLYVDGYHEALDRRLGAATPATEIISEVYVPRRALPTFLADVRRDFRANRVELIYGTIRFIERDDESFLAWAKAPYACVIFNLHTVHDPAGVARSAEAFRRLIDLAIGSGGSYFLTYHRFATRRQVEGCYPQFAAFLRSKRTHDPAELFQSEWYRHYTGMFADALRRA